MHRSIGKGEILESSLSSRVPLSIEKNICVGLYRAVLFYLLDLFYCIRDS